MVVARVSTEPERFELKTLPGAYVVLKRMTFGQKLHRKELAMGDARLTGIGKKGRKAQQSTEMVIAIIQRLVAEYEFKHSIVEHNLEFEEGKPFNFDNGKSLDILDPRVGEEIEALIGKLNNFDEEEDDDPSGN